jgi:tight adherence protein B
MQNALYPLIYVLAFVAVVMLVQALASILFSSRDRKRRVNRRLAMLESGRDPARVYADLVRAAAPSGPQNSVLSKLHRRISLYCRQAGLSLSPVRLVTMIVGAAGLLWLLSLAFLGGAEASDKALNSLTSLLASVIVAALGGLLWVTRKRAARLKAIEEQLPLALDVVNRALRAGHPVISAVQLAAQEMGDPIGSELGLIVDETTYGYEFKEALVNFARRTGSADAHFFAVSVGIQSETGGSLSEILAGLATVIRARFTLAKRVKALASEGRASAVMLSVLPVLLIALLGLTQPTYYTSKFSDPIFWPAVGGVCTLYLLGWLMLRKIINFKY